MYLQYIYFCMNVLHVKWNLACPITVFHISYVTTNTQKYKITSMKKNILGSCWSGQRFSSASRLMFSIAMHWGKKSPWTHPLQWSVVMSSHAAFMASNWDIWSCGLWSYTFHLHAGKNSSIGFRNREYGGRNSTVAMHHVQQTSPLTMMVRWKLTLSQTTTSLGKCGLTKPLSCSGIVCLKCLKCV